MKQLAMWVTGLCVVLGLGFGAAAQTTAKNGYPAPITTAASGKSAAASPKKADAEPVGHLAFYSDQNLTPEERTLAQEAIDDMRAHWEAWKNEDKAFFAANLSEIGTYFGPWHPYLETHDRVTFLEKFDEACASPNFKLATYNIEQPIHVNVYDNVAILAYNMEVTMLVGGAPANYTNKVTAVFVKENGKWRTVHGHESL